MSTTNRPTRSTSVPPTTERDFLSPPYLPEGRGLSYVSGDYDGWCELAMRKSHLSRCQKAQAGALVVKGGVLLGTGTNDPKSPPDVCPRLKMATGVGYDLCWYVCHQPAHAEVDAIENALSHHQAALLKGADLYLAGHWWVCYDCWTLILKYRLRDVFIVVANWKEEPPQVGHPGGL